MNSFLFAELCLKSGHSHEVDMWVDRSTNTHFAFDSSFGHILLKKRTRVPETFVLQYKNKILCGYGLRGFKEFLQRHGLEKTIDKFFDKEYLIIEIDSKQRHLNIFRDSYGTLPVTYYYDDEKIIFGNDIDELAKHLRDKELTINTRLLLQQILLVHSHNATYFEELKLIRPEEIIYFQDGKLNHVNSENSKAIGDIDDQNAVHFAALLEERLDVWYQDYELDMQTAFDLSGGLDSSLVAGYFADKYKIKPLCSTMVFYGDSRKTQLEKTNSFKNHFSAEVLETILSPSKHYPFADIAQTGSLNLNYPYRGVYTMADKERVLNLSKLGIKILVSGEGGDELFASRIGHRGLSKSELADAVKKKQPPEYISTYLSKNLYSVTNNLRGDQPESVGVIPRSVTMGSTIISNTQIDCDIWPVHPLSDYLLFEFCQRLSPNFRKNKELARIYMEVRGFPEILTRPAVNEDFSSFAEEAMKSYGSRFLEDVMESSVLVKNNLIGYESIMDIIKRLKQGDNSYLAVFGLYTILAIELNLQAVPNSKLPNLI